MKIVDFKIAQVQDNSIGRSYMPSANHSVIIALDSDGVLWCQNLNEPIKWVKISNLETLEKEVD